MLQRRQVTIAHKQGEIVIVSAGLEAGELVVVTRLDVMFEGLKVDGSDA